MRSSITSRALELPELIEHAQMLILQYGELPKTNEPYEILRQSLRAMGADLYPHDRITSIAVDFSERKDVPSGYDVKISVQSNRGVLKIETVYTMSGERLELYERQYKLEQELANVRAALGEF
jgi:hypothetical protein